jgi:hypothetical protein
LGKSRKPVHFDMSRGRAGVCGPGSGSSTLRLSSRPRVIPESTTDCGLRPKTLRPCQSNILLHDVYRQQSLRVLCADYRNRHFNSKAIMLSMYVRALHAIGQGPEKCLIKNTTQRARVQRHTHYKNTICRRHFSRHWRYLSRYTERAEGGAGNGAPKRREDPCKLRLWRTLHSQLAS